MARRRQGGRILICVAGQNPFGDVLEAWSATSAFTALSLATEGHPRAEPDCDVLFTPRTANSPVYLQAAGGLPTLTVGETPRFIEQGGMINFYLETEATSASKSTAAAAQRAKLRISSRLLQLREDHRAGSEER